ncbi:putative RNA-directed DNA polymerase, eukaryota, reverse transcriptase zinc-binding domain protein [Tanacetum coccineum]|uniref:RNA-directed DNA polymerase, eukaryota, reverse transcriptase zinc-binding domain protein n=1 Tax=Tanacetum coccineum TaxID=301880 RepID=A0ABQ5DZ36_9ASTR
MLLFKVDFKKAFDSVNWEFLFDIMSQMNFGSKWRKWISSCLSSALVSVLINGSSSKEFKMERGLRQGDPLSSFLFLIVAEALQVMIIEACNKGIFKGLSLGDDSSNISLLQFADDALFFSEWSKSNVRHLIHILDCFHDVSGLKINLEKADYLGSGSLPRKFLVLRDHGALWRRVIVELHGVNGGFDQTTRQGCNSGTWANIVRSCFDLAAGRVSIRYSFMER